MLLAPLRCGGLAGGSNGDAATSPTCLTGACIKKTTQRERRDLMVTPRAWQCVDVCVALE
jgi:hypothetical protein